MPIKSVAVIENEEIMEAKEFEEAKLDVQVIDPLDPDFDDEEFQDGLIGIIQPLLASCN